MKPVVESNIEPISEPEMREAERSIVKCVQEKHFKEKIECLNGNQDIVTVIPSQRPKGGSVKRGSSIFWCSGGRNPGCWWTVAASFAA